MRTVTVEKNQIVIRDIQLNVTIHYSDAIVRKRIRDLEAELETWREYERLLTSPKPDHEHYYHPVAAGGPLRCVICDAPYRGINR